MPRPRPRPKLYWVETDDHCEDWFIVARSARDARRFHEELEGYGRGEARSTLVMALEEGVKDGWPTLESLVEWGMSILRHEQPRVVEYKGHRYAEGVFEYTVKYNTDNVLELDGRGRPNGTVRRMIQ